MPVVMKPWSRLLPAYTSREIWIWDLVIQEWHGNAHGPDATILSRPRGSSSTEGTILSQTSVGSRWAHDDILDIVGWQEGEIPWVPGEEKRLRRIREYHLNVQLEYYKPVPTRRPRMSFPATSGVP